MTDWTKTHLAFHYDAHLHTQETEIQSVQSFSAIPDADKALFKGASDDSHIVTTASTIFHPQGGGQPSDEGTITTPTSTFTVLAARTSTTSPSTVLHHGTFTSTPFSAPCPATQTIDSAKRTYYSRLHTAGHVLGGAVRHLLEKDVPGFDELKASHFPDSAGCEFQGLIGGEHKAAIQGRVDQYIAAKYPVEIEWWGRAEFEAEGLERLIPEGWKEGEGEKLRVVRIRGVECYPCGGTHVDTTDLCGKTTVKKISRSKGNSRVSYSVQQ